MSDDLSTEPNDKRLIQGLLQALDTFMKLRGHIPLQELIVFLHVALDEGNESIEYAHRLKVPRSVLSRVAHDLADRTRGGGPGLGLIEFKHRGSNLYNRKPIFLTKKGRSVVAAILRRLRSPPTA